MEKGLVMAMDLEMQDMRICSDNLTCQPPAVQTKADDCKKTQILKFLGINYILEGKNIKPTYRLPFNYLAEIKESITNMDAKNR
ncbi:MAG: hypothetical protein LBL16_05385 [Endomicrobium sp.]|nr:hypothetical protein [Endomicrobium sp.]